MPASFVFFCQRAYSPPSSPFHRAGVAESVMNTLGQNAAQRWSRLSQQLLLRSPVLCRNRSSIPPVRLDYDALMGAASLHHRASRPLLKIVPAVSPILCGLDDSGAKTTLTSSHPVTAVFQTVEIVGRKGRSEYGNILRNAFTPPRRFHSGIFLQQLACESLGPLSKQGLPGRWGRTAIAFLS